MDSSTAILVRPTAPPLELAPEDLDSSRYKVKSPKEVVNRDVDMDADEEGKPGDLIPSPVPPKKAPPPPPKVKAIVTEEPAPPAQPVVAQVRELVLGGSEEEIQEHQKKVHPQDPRANTLRISLAPAYYYNGSQSQYSFRDYNNHGPGFGLGMNLWLTPFFGLQSQFFSSLGASQRSEGINTASSELQDFQIGIRFRKHFGFTRRAPMLAWGFDYTDSKYKISKTALTSVGRRSSGVDLSLEAQIPASVRYSHTLGLDLRPRQKHSELDSGVSLRSGGKNETNAIGLSLGGEWALDRRNQMFWKSQMFVERNLFSGQASMADPSSGQTPTGVAVTNTLLIFYFGFHWGS